MEVWIFEKGKTMNYINTLTQAMTEISTSDDALFVGQSVKYPGTGMFQTFEKVPDQMKIEVPVFENTQLGLCIGLSLAGYHPIVCTFPRINFLLEAVSQLVQHLDLLPIYSDSGFTPRVIIRTAVAHSYPLDPGPQHLGDYSAALESMLKTVRVRRLDHANVILPAYRAAVAAPYPTLLVEYARLYDEESAT